MNFEKLVSRIPTLFTQRHAHIIYGLIRWLQPESVLEIGAYHGYVSVHIAKALKDNGGDGVFHIIDDFTLGTDASQLHNNLNALDVNGNTYIINADSSKLPKFPPCEFAFIDGNHGYTGCLSDIDKCIASGCQCFVLHDVQSWWGVNEVVKKHIEGFYTWSHAFDIIQSPFDEGLAIFLIKPKIGEPKYTKEQFPEGYVK